MEIKIYEGAYDKRDFYYYMGDIFASKKIRRELPYLCNEEGRRWFLAFENDQLIGFSSLQFEKVLMKIRNTYVFEEYRSHGILKILLDTMFEYIKKNEIKKVIQVAVKKHVVGTYEQLGFKEYKRTKNYVFMKRGMTADG